MESGRRGFLVGVLALMLTLNNGAFAALAFIGLSAPDGSAIAASSKPPTVSVVDYAQCANDAAPSTSTACPGGWINGILNANNSHYPEGTVTPQRAEVSYPAGAAITGATLTFKYETTKGGIHSYDSLATWNYTQTTANKDQGLNSADIVGGSPSLFQMASDPTASGHELASANRFWTMYGGSLTGATVPQHDCTTSTLQCASDDYATVTVTYDVPASTSVRNIQLLFGGHIAVGSGPLGWGAGLGAGSVQGGPYHVKWIAADDTAIGNRDNQITSGTITIPPSLSITKTTSTASVALGGTATFTIGVTNSASVTDNATGVQVTDTLPTGFTYASLTSATGGTRTATVNPTAGQTSLTFGTWTLAPGETVSITFTATAPSGAGACTSYNNNASFTSTNGGSGTTTTAATVTVTGCAPSLSITKTTSTSSVALGGTATFNIQVANSANATATATGVQVTDTLPTGFTYAALTSATGGTRTATVNPTAGQTSLTFGTWSLAPGQTLSITFTATAPSTANSCGSYNNNAAYTSTNAGSGSTSSPAAVTVTGCSGNLSITKTTSTASVALGGTATFTITVTNAANATLTATGVQITDTLPTGFVYAATGTVGGTGTRTATVNPTAGDTSLTFGTWSLAPGQTASVTFTATAPSGANSCAAYNNNASVSSGNDGSANTASPATVTVTGCAAALSITKTTSTSSVALGGAASFTITVTNSANATATATGVQITDTLPAGFVFASGTSGGTGTRTATTNPTAGDTSLSWGTWSLAPGQTATATFTATAPSTANSCGSYNNNAAYTSTNAGSSSTSSPATVTVTGCSGNLSITKTTSTASVALGGTATFTITVTNAANATLTATGVQITDTLPTGFVYAATVSQDGTGSLTSPTAPAAGDTSLTFGTWSLAPGETAVVTFQATAPSTANSCGDYNNNAAYSSTNAGSGSTAAAATVTVTGCAPGITITKTTSTASVSLGGAASFTITVTNSANATATATGVQITDTLPAGFVFASGTSGGTGTRTATTNPTAGQTSLAWGTWSLAPGQTATATFIATAPSTANSCGSYSNNATVTWNPENSASTTSPATVTVTGCTIVTPPQLSVSKTADATLVTASAQGGSRVGFTITLTNTGSVTTTATLSDTPLVAAGPTTPAGNAGTNGLTWSIDAAASDAGCSITANSLSCNFGNLAPGASRHVHITSPVAGRLTATSRNDNCGQRVDNVATATMGNGNSLQSNHATVDIACLPATSAGALTITKYSDNNGNATKDSGEAFLAGWTFEVKNNATGAVQSVTTGSNGSVTVTGLEFGQYTVTEKSCASPCDITKWTAISYQVGTGAVVKSSSGAAQVSISSPQQSVTFGNRPPQLPSTSTSNTNGSPLPGVALLLIAAMLAEIAARRMRVRVAKQQG